MAARLVRLVLAFALWTLFAPDLLAREVRVAFINPGAEQGADVWALMSRFMKAAAQQFGFRFEVLYSDRDRVRMVALAREVAQRPLPPDYVVLVNEKQQAPEMMEFFRGTPVRLVLLHNDLTPEQRQLMGNERERLPNWIGTITSDDRAVAAALMGGLYGKAKGEPLILGIGGDKATPVSAEREEGVRNFVAAAGRGRLLQVVPGNWARDDAAIKTHHLLQRYPEANMVWAANDTMALGALDAVIEMKMQGQVEVGGLGAFPQALDSVETGGLAITTGTHLVAGAWSMVMIHDYDQGRDFAAAGGPHIINNTIIKVADATAAARFRELLEQPQRVDFHRFSRADNPQLAAYDFSYEAMLAAAK